MVAAAANVVAASLASKSHHYDFLRPAKRKILRLLQHNGCEPAYGRRSRCDFVVQALCRKGLEDAEERGWGYFIAQALQGIEDHCVPNLQHYQKHRFCTCSCFSHKPVSQSRSALEEHHNVFQSSYLEKLASLE